MSNVDVDDQAGLMRFTQKRRVTLATELMDGKKAGEMSDTHLGVTRNLLNDIDKSVISQQRLDLEKRNTESDEERNRLVASIVDRVIGGGGMMPQHTGDEATKAAAPTPSLNQLPEAKFADGETKQGVENIEYDDVMNTNRQD